MSNQFVYLTEPANLQEGLYWARRMPDKPNPHGPWIMIGLIGHSPFLVFYQVVSFNQERHEWSPHANYCKDGTRVENPLDPSRWEFGPRIDPPSKWANLTYPPIETKAQP